MKKAGIFILSLLVLGLIVFSFLVLAQETPPGVPRIPTIVNEQNINNINQGIANAGNESYLQQEWKKMLLSNKFVSALNSFFSQSIPSSVFRVLFGEFYSFSFSLPIVIILWIIFAFLFARTFQASGLTKGSLSYLWGVIASIALSQPPISLFRLIIDKSVQLYNFTQSIWFKIIIIIALIVAAILIYFFWDWIILYLKARKLKKEAEEVKESGKGIINWFKTFTQTQKELETA